MINVRRSFCIGVALLLLAAAVGAQEKPLRVLFVGNSYTYFHKMPQLLVALAGKGKLEVERVTAGGATFERHVQMGEVKATLQKKKFDWVVLQEQSTRPLVDYRKMREFGKALDKEIKKSGARTMLFMTWARRHAPGSQGGLTSAYQRLAKELEATVAPVGTAWQKVVKERPFLALHHLDGSHPGPPGAYLTACVFYAALVGKSPEGLPCKVSPGGKKAVEVDKEDAAFLQKIAWDVVKRSRKS